MRLLLNIIWFVLAGLWLAIGYAVAALITGALLCLTIIGIPPGLASFKLIPVSLTPFGHIIVPVQQAQAAGYDSRVTVG